MRICRLMVTSMAEKTLPLSKRVGALCELTGLDPLYLANEGAAVLVSDPRSVERIRRTLNGIRPRLKCTEIGQVTDGEKGRVFLETLSGGRRILEMMSGEQLPRIC